MNTCEFAIKNGCFKKTHFASLEMLSGIYAGVIFSQDRKALPSEVTAKLREAEGAGWEALSTESGTIQATMKSRPARVETIVDDSYFLHQFL